MIRNIIVVLTVIVCTQCSIVKRSSWNELPVANHHTENVFQNDSNTAPEKYIAGGGQAEVGQYPWVVRLSLNVRKTGKSYRCGGTIISKRHVLSAAHCFKQDIEDSSDVDIYLGEYDTDSFPRDCVEDTCVENKLVHANKIIVHPQYNPKTIANDIALLRLEKPIPKSASISPIPLPPFNVDNPINDGAPVIVAGWGRTEDNVLSKVLLTTELSLIPKKKCLELRPTVPLGHLCAGNSYGKDTCPGDSGGPLVMVYKKKYYLAGIVSYGPDAKCGTASSGYYTNVYKYLKWIKGNMKV